MYNYSKMSDEDLLELYYDEKEEKRANLAFAELDERYRSRLITSLMVPGYNKHFIKLFKMPGQQEQAEQLVSEALFKVADSKRKAARWDRSRQKVGPWLFGILHNVVVSYLRKKHVDVKPDADFHKPDQMEETTSPLEAIPDKGQGPEEALQQQALTEVLLECVQELPEPLRTLCELLFDKRLKQNEIARKLKLSPPTLTRRKQEACSRLRDCLRRKGVAKEILN